jgi:ketosteroid isomerase-like protein
MSLILNGGMSSLAQEPARRLYDAFAARDPAAILAALHPEFTGTVSAGMPLGTGGRHDGPDAMLAAVWGPVFGAYDVRVEPDAFLAADGDRVVVLGHYRGTGRASGAPLDARFAHVLAVRDDRIATLEQITDTARWHAALGPAVSHGR